MNNLIPVIPVTKEAVVAQSQVIIELLERGEINPLDLIKLRKCVEEMFKNIKPTLDKMAVDEADKYGKKFDYQGAKIEVREFGTTYSYDNCNDPKYKEILEQFNSWNEAKKDREKFLQNLKEPFSAVDIETGETYTIYPPVKKSTTLASVTL